MTTVAIHQPVFMPYLGTFAKTASADIHVFLDDVQLNTRNFTRRCKIRTSINDVTPRWLTVPLNHSRSKLIKETTVDLSDSNATWFEDTQTTINHVYRKAKCYDQVNNGLVKHFFDAEHMKCLNNNFATWTTTNYIMACYYLNIGKRFVFSSELAHVYNIRSTGNQRLIDICTALHADAYLSGEAGIDYMNMDDWSMADIDVVIGRYVQKPYDNIPEGVTPFSFIDALYTLGIEETRKLMFDSYTTTRVN